MAACKLVLAALVSLGFAVACPGGAQAQDARQGLSATDLFKMARDAVSDGRTADALVLYEALTRDSDAEIRAEARFRMALLLGEQRRYEEAAVTLRALLDEKPDAAPARIELARMLSLAGRDSAARRELRQVQAGVLPPAVALAVDQFAATLRSRKPLGGSLEIALAPDSNINRATDARALDTVIAPLVLSEDARARSGVGMRLSGQVFARVPVAPGLSILPRLSARADTYGQPQFNDISASGLVGVEWQRNRERLTISAGRTRRWYGGSGYATTSTLTLDGLRSIGRSRQADISLGVARARYDDNALQNGVIGNLELGYEQALDVRSGWRASVNAVRQWANDPGYSTASAGISLLGWSELWKSTVFVTASVSRLEGDQRLSLFPDRRREWFTQYGMGASLRRFTFRGFAPVVRLRVERNRSTIGIYDFKRVVIEGGLTRAF